MGLDGSFCKGSFSICELSFGLASIVLNVTASETEGAGSDDPMKAVKGLLVLGEYPKDGL